MSLLEGERMGSLSMLEAVVCVGLGAVKTFFCCLAWPDASLPVSVSHFLSLSFSVKCSDTTTGKIVSAACTLFMAFSALGLVFPK